MKRRKYYSTGMGVIRLVSNVHLKHLRANWYQKGNKKAISCRSFNVVHTLTLVTSQLTLQKKWKLTFAPQTQASHSQSPRTGEGSLPQTAHILLRLIPISLNSSAWAKYLPRLEIITLGKSAIPFTGVLVGIATEEFKRLQQKWNICSLQQHDRSQALTRDWNFTFLL